MSSKFSIRDHIAPVGSPHYDPKAKIPFLPKAKYLGPVEFPDISGKPLYSVVTESEHFGSKDGEKFDEGAYWFPIQGVTIAHSHKGIHSFQGHYATRDTEHVGAPKDRHPSHKFVFESDELIVGVSGTAGDRVHTLKIHTNKRIIDCGGGKHDTGKPFAYTVPEDHHVVSFVGHADDNHIRAIGVVYIRKLPTHEEALASFREEFGDPEPEMVLETPCAQMFLTPEMKTQWAIEGAAFRERLRKTGQKDLLPVYTNVENNDQAFGWFEVGGEKLLISYSDTAMIYSWTEDIDDGKITAQEDKKSKHNQLGSYTVTGNALGISNYVWTNLPVTVTVLILSQAFTTFLKNVIKTGIEWAAAYASRALIDALLKAGFERAATLVSGSRIASGGLTIAGAAIGIGLFFAFTALASLLVKKFVLVVDITNHDTEDWVTSGGWYGDNAKVSNDTWLSQRLDAYTPPGPVKRPPPGVYEPIEAIDGVLTYTSVVFENKRTFLGQLGVSFACSPASDASEGFSAKYGVWVTKDNQMGITGGVSNIEGFYNDQSSWHTLNTTKITVQVNNKPMTVVGFSPALGGDSDHVYRYALDIWPGEVA